MRTESTQQKVWWQMERRTLTVDEAAQALGISRASAYKAVERGEIPTLRLGKRLVVPRTKFEEMLSGVPVTASA